MAKSPLHFPTIDNDEVERVKLVLQVLTYTCVYGEGSRHELYLYSLDAGERAMKLLVQQCQKIRALEAQIDSLRKELQQTADQSLLPQGFLRDEEAVIRMWEEWEEHQEQQKQQQQQQEEEEMEDEKEKKEGDL